MELYKLDSKGKIRSWLAYSLNDVLVVQTGILGGKLVTTSKRIEPKGKNTAEEQAKKEVLAAYESKRKEGYVDSLEDAKKGILDSIIKGGILPMLAHVAEDLHSINYPVYVQPKLDGHRCIAIKDKTGITLWSRTRKQITSCPHIITELEHALSGIPEIILDGELYVHDVLNFEELTGAIRKQEPSEKSSMIEYHIYDVVMDRSFQFRLCFLDTLENDKHAHLKFVRTEYATCKGDVTTAYSNALQEGYEGLMIRNPKAPYEHKRSKGLLKLKVMLDDEFPIVGIREGAMATVIMVVKLPDGSTNDVTMSGPRQHNQKFLDDPSKYLGKLLTVQYQRLTADKKLLFPVGLRIRQDI